MITKNIGFYMIPTITETMASETFFGTGGILHGAIMFMLRFTWQSRYRLPMLIIIILIAIDYRLQLALEFDINPELYNHL